MIMPSDWETALNSYLANKMQAKNALAGYYNQQANSSSNPGAYYAQLAYQARSQPNTDPHMAAQNALLAAQTHLAEQQALTAAETLRQNQVVHQGYNVFNQRGLPDIYPLMNKGSGGGGGGRGGGGGGVGQPEESFAEEDARRQKALAVAQHYQQMQSGTGPFNDQTYGPGQNPWSGSYAPKTTGSGFDIPGAGRDEYGGWWNTNDPNLDFTSGQGYMGGGY